MPTQQLFSHIMGRTS